MRVSLDWLKEFVAIEERPEQVAERLTSLGFEVEEIEKFGLAWTNIVTAKIIQIRPHPNADKLKLVTISDGQSRSEVVCGASNIKIEQKVPFVREGAALPDGQTIARVTIRGIESRGMLCSAQELGLGEDRSGILILDQKIKVGLPLSEALGLADTVFDVNIPPQRPDCFSVYGLAREYAASSGRKLKKITTRVSPARRISRQARHQSGTGQASLKVRIADRLLCPFYSGRLITGLGVNESPLWLKRRLLASGLRPINNVVDITNYVMLETGQPLHAFDTNRLTQRNGSFEIFVRKAQSGEALEMIDGAERTLRPDMLVIADANTVLAVAGIMGGQESEVSGNTKSIILESAVFQARSIRATSQRLGLRTESSTRFEKGLNPENAWLASNRAVELLLKLASGKISQETPLSGDRLKSTAKFIKLSKSWLDSFLGVKLSAAEVSRGLSRLGCQVRVAKQSISAKPPSWRTDLVYPADLAEEVGRLHNYNNFNPTLMEGRIKPVTLSPELEFIEQTKDLLVKAGFAELYGHSFYGESEARQSGYPIEDHYLVKNPLSPDQRFLRTSLWPGLHQLLARQTFRSQMNKFFEIGKVFLLGKWQPQESYHLGALIIRPRATQEEIYRELVGLSEEILGQTRPELRIAKTQAGRILLRDNSGKEVGLIYLLNQAEQAELKLDNQAGYLELDLGQRSASGKRQPKFRSYSIYPGIERDLALVVPEKVTFEQICRLIYECNSKTATPENPDGLIREVTVFGGIYRGAEIGPGRKSVPIRVYYQSSKRTLRHEEADKIQKNIIQQLYERLGAIARGQAQGTNQGEKYA